MKRTKAWRVWLIATRTLRKCWTIPWWRRFRILRRSISSDWCTGSVWPLLSQSTRLYLPSWHRRGMSRQRGEECIKYVFLIASYLQQIHCPQVGLQRRWSQCSHQSDRRYVAGDIAPLWLDRRQHGQERLARARGQCHRGVGLLCDWSNKFTRTIWHCLIRPSLCVVAVSHVASSLSHGPAWARRSFIRTRQCLLERRSDRGSTTGWVHRRHFWPRRSLYLLCWC